MSGLPTWGETLPVRVVTLQYERRILPPASLENTEGTEDEKNDYLFKSKNHFTIVVSESFSSPPCPPCPPCSPAKRVVKNLPYQRLL